MVNPPHLLLASFACQRGRPCHNRRTDEAAGTVQSVIQLAWEEERIPELGWLAQLPKVRLDSRPQVCYTCPVKRSNGYELPTVLSCPFGSHRNPHLPVQKAIDSHPWMHVCTAGRSIAPRLNPSPTIRRACLSTHSCLDSWVIYTYHVVSLHRSKRRDLLWRRLR